jgi:alkylation response protein AidB-like acyl-CoA dehydrogenase
VKFHLSPEQIAIQDAIRGTLADCWKVEHLHKFAASGTDFDPESWNALMALGLGSILIPDSGGGGCCCRATHRAVALCGGGLALVKRSGERESFRT